MRISSFFCNKKTLLQLLVLRDFGLQVSNSFIAQSDNRENDRLNLFFVWKYGKNMGYKWRIYSKSPYLKYQININEKIVTTIDLAFF